MGNWYKQRKGRQMKTRVVNLALDYREADLKSESWELIGGRAVKTGTDFITKAELTRRLIAGAVQFGNRDGAIKATTKMWARIKRVLDASEGIVELPEDHFDFLADLVDKCHYAIGNADAAALLYDELEAVKLRKPEAVKPVEPVGSPDGAGTPEVAEKIMV